MKNIPIKSLILCACVLTLSVAASAQKRDHAVKINDDSTGTSIIKGTGKTAVVVVGSAAKATWWTTKFTAKHVAKPVFTKAAPVAGKFVFRKSVKYLLPLAAKLSIL